MDRQHRLNRLESALKRRKASWRLKDGTTVSVFNDELWDCFTTTMRRREHPLLEWVLNADMETYDGDSTVLSLIQKICESRQRQFDTSN